MSAGQAGGSGGGAAWGELVARRARRWSRGVRDHRLTRVAYDVPAVSAVALADVPGRAAEDWPDGDYACVGVRFAARLGPLPRGRRYVAVYLRVRLDDHRAAVVDLRASGGPAGPGGRPSGAADPGYPGQGDRTSGGWGAEAWGPEAWGPEGRGPEGWGPEGWGSEAGGFGRRGSRERGSGVGNVARVSATGLGDPVFDWLFGDVTGRQEVPGACAGYALLRVPSGMAELAGELRVDSSVRHPAFWRAPGTGAVEHVRARAPWRFTVPVPLLTPLAPPRTPAARDVPVSRRVPPEVTAASGPSGEGTFAEGPFAPVGRPREARVPDGVTRVRLCLAADMERFSRFRNPEAVRAQRRLADVLAQAREHAGLADADVDLQLSGDGQFAVLPEHLDETVVIPLLVEGLRQSLAEVNADLSEHARVRLRVAVHRGLTTRARNGWVGDATIAVRRILDSAAAREALSGHPGADFVLIVPDGLYRDVIGHGYGRLRPETFHQVEATLPEKGFTERAWIHIPAT
ncbi:hypothetical protein [Sphaerisporangium aureirubrum]|uniref:GGDEF domain-containing protein n=1 Tax=Sphaerisporangium aureirubrum TaxID=1544736 RepID=A0ABW1NKA2_9ACTN